MQRPKISEKTKAKIRLIAKNRCGYCLCQQEYVWDILEIDHIYPLAKGGKTSEENLWLICSTCNNAKYNKTEAFDSITEKTFRFLIREFKIGTNILVGAKTERKLSATQPLVGQQSTPCI